MSYIFSRPETIKDSGWGYLTGSDTEGESDFWYFLATCGTQKVEIQKKPIESYGNLRLS